MRITNNIGGINKGGDMARGIKETNDELNLLKELEGLAERAGLNIVVGGDVVIEKMIDLAPKGGSMPHCSGYGVFPDGKKCEGCPDCKSL